VDKLCKYGGNYLRKTAKKVTSESVIRHRC